jgi:hypothetical protein
MNATHQQPATTAKTQAGLSSPHPAATHQGAGGVVAARADGTRLGLGTTPCQYLPLYAKVAIERLDCASDLRTAAQLDELLQAYATTYGQLVDLETCAASHHICARRFPGFVAFPGLGA